jgi:hypothetical protein
MNIPRNSHSGEARFGCLNPFTEVDPKDSAPADEELASSALAGNKDSLETLVRRTPVLGIQHIAAHALEARPRGGCNTRNLDQSRDQAEHIQRPEQIPDMALSDRVRSKKRRAIFVKEDSFLAISLKFPRKFL